MKQYCYQCGEYSLNVDSMEAVCIAYSSDAFIFCKLCNHATVSLWNYFLLLSAATIGTVGLFKKSLRLVTVIFCTASKVLNY